MDSASSFGRLLSNFSTYLGEHLLKDPIGQICRFISTLSTVVMGVLGHGVDKIHYRIARLEV